MKFLLDTNALCEPTKVAPNASFLRRFAQHAGDSCTSVLSLHELVFGISILPRSIRKDRLTAYVDALQTAGLVILPYNEAAARWHALERARLVRAGRTSAFVDGQIAGIAVAYGLTLITRNKRDFTDFRELRIDSWWPNESVQSKN